MRLAMDERDMTTMPWRAGLPARPVALLSALVFLALAFGGATSARAQNSDVQSLSDKVDRLQQELSDLERQVYNGQVPAGSVAATTPSGDAAANQEVRLQQLETQMSTLTGQIETLTYNLQQLSARVDKLSQDVDFRLSALEHGQPAAAGAAAGGVAGATAGGQAPTLGAPQPAGQASDANTPLRQSSLQPTTLGTLTQSQTEANAAQPAANGASATPAATSAVPAANAGATYQLPGDTVEAQYEYAFDLLRQANYDEAEKALRAFVTQHPTDLLAGNAQYWLGETYYVRGKYEDAAVAFAEGYQKYPDSSKAPDNLLKLGMSLGQIGKKSDACVAFSELNKKFPSASDSIRERLKQEKKRYGCA
jgi:tol-pal system protein YbgF